MPRVRAIKEVRYAGVNRVPETDSQDFDTTLKDATLLSRIGKVRILTDEETEPVRKGRVQAKTQNPVKSTPTGNKELTTQQPNNNPVPQPAETPVPAKSPEPEKAPVSATTTSDVPNSAKGTYQTRDLKADGR